VTVGRDGQRPGRKLSRTALVGRRVAVRQSEGRVHTATVTTFAPGEGSPPPPPLVLSGHAASFTPY
jgi:hypothetical protein